MFGCHFSFNDWTNIANYVINDTWYSDRKESTIDEAERIIATAAKLILGDIRATEFDNTNYPNNENIENLEKGKEWLPRYLRLFMEKLINYPLKQVSIGQAIVHATRPRSSIPPILFGVGVEMDHVFGSKWLLNELGKLGFTVSSDEVTRYKQAVVESENVTNFLDNYFPGSFTQFSADNVDHNVRSLNGKDTLHAMGIVASTTHMRGSSLLMNLHPIKRQKIKRVTEVIKNKEIEIKTYITPQISGLSMVKLKPLGELLYPYTLPPDLSMNLIWHMSIFFQRNERPNWSGYMTNVSVGDYPGKSTVSLLPIINLNPNDLTCIYSTLVFVIDQAKKLNLETAVITFDQPLWYKAMEITNAKSLDVVLVLGGFHLMMSFLGCVGMVMDGSGITDALKTIYGSNTVQHMMSGKAISRALRGHFLATSALTTKLICNIIPNDIKKGLDCDKEGDNSGVMGKNEVILTDTEVEKIKEVAERVVQDPESAMEVIASSNELRRLDTALELYKDELLSKSRTAKLWLQYLLYVDVIKLFIRAERTGNWHLHLIAVGKMLNLFAATAHVNYAKSARLYLQSMLELQTKYPWVYNNFQTLGYHTVRRNDRFWSGLWTDLIIEQVLMRSLKSRGGLTRGKGSYGDSACHVA